MYESSNSDFLGLYNVTKAFLISHLKSYIALEFFLRIERQIRKYQLKSYFKGMDKNTAAVFLSSNAT